ncbi:MAG: right-handed parallel beta-helix repeat-containing protein [Tannerella sp.]|jgi:parallel beta-helix repeat protein|nr:right-handed parallel beta-helix repeat-containing protein [Tannerella sp.]
MKKPSFFKRTIIRTILFGYFLFHLGMLHAQTYYVSPSGNDANNGTSPATAWATIERVNQVIPSLKPGNSVLFERGGTYYGSMYAWKVSGTENNPITIGAYGVGKAPVISGAKQVTGWEKIGANLWKASVPESPGDIDILFIDGKKHYPGRYPNNGYLTVTDKYSGGLQDNTLSFPDGYWDGATVAFRIYAWEIRRDTVAHSYSDGRIDKFGDNADKLPVPGFGYFLQNHIHALDIVGEWVYDKQEKSLTLFTDKNPNGQRIEYMDAKRGIEIQYPWATNHDCYIHIEDLHFRHYREYGIYGFCGKKFEIRHNTFTDSQSGIGLGDFDECIIAGNTFSDMENTGVDVGNLKNSRIQDNVIQRIGMSLDHGWSAGISMGMFANDHTPNNDCEITGNKIDHVGYNAIFVYFSQNLLIKNNVIDYSMLCLSDGGGIYIGNDPSIPRNLKGIQIIDNIVMNTIGNIDGLPDDYPWRHGIYLDDGTGYVSVKGNTVVNCGNGIHMHGAHHNTIHGNVLFNNNLEHITAQDNPAKQGMQFTGNDLQYNYMYQDGSPVYLMSIQDMDMLLNSNQIENNYISAPFSSTFALMRSGGNANSKDAWTTRTNFDLHSKAEPVSYAASGVGSPDKFAVLVYNPTSEETVITLDNTYMTFDSVAYAGSIKLAPFESAILFRCKNAPVVITTQPVDLTVNEGAGDTLRVTATNATGYQWQKLDGNIWTDISGATGASYTIDGAIPSDAGSYRVIVSGLGNTEISAIAIVIVNDATAIPILPSASFLAFPNPVKKGQFLTVQTGTDASMDEFEISIYDLNGKLQKQYHSTQTEVSIPAPDNAGYYVLRLKAKRSGTIQQAIIVVQ